MNSLCDKTILRDTYYLSAYGQRLYVVCNPGNKTSIIKAYFKKPQTQLSQLHTLTDFRCNFTSTF